jgi:hypothetical protein
MIATLRRWNRSSALLASTKCSTTSAPFGRMMNSGRRSRRASRSARLLSSSSHSRPALRNGLNAKSNTPAVSRKDHPRLDALTLSLLGEFLKRACHGDIRQRDLLKLEEADAEGQGARLFEPLLPFGNGACATAATTPEEVKSSTGDSFPAD